MRLSVMALTWTGVASLLSSAVYLDLLPESLQDCLAGHRSHPTSLDPVLLTLSSVCRICVYALLTQVDIHVCVDTHPQHTQ